ncbi:hypothetical protein STRDD11_02694 [Streptococcus sp. DD11]|nr:hypothetical protein STRDD11_02694 [Streptococcus sp. DD11]
MDYSIAFGSLLAFMTLEKFPFCDKMRGKILLLRKEKDDPYN